MVFYEQYLLLSHRVAKNEMRNVLHGFTKTITADNNGYVIRMKDLGWRRTAHRVSKQKAGLHHFGRWMYLSYGCSPETPTKVQQQVLASPYVLRSTIVKLKPKTMLNP